MVGYPGSGKSHFAQVHLKDYVRVNRDTLGTWQLCVAEMKKMLDAGKSVVVDNTNPDSKSRQRYIEVAKSKSVPVRCFVMSADIEHTKHNNKYREMTDKSHQSISDMIIYSYR